MCWVVYIACAICVLFILFLRYTRIKGTIDQRDWDMATITSSDFTVEMPLEKDAIDKWFKDDYLKGAHKDGKSKLLALKEHLTAKIETLLT